MSTMQSEVFEALRAIDIPEDRALKAATALSRRDQDVAGLTGDVSVLKTDVAGLKGDAGILKGDVSVLKRDMAVLKWMVGTLYPLELAIFGMLAAILVHLMR